MIVKNNNIVIPVKFWNDLKKIDYFRELIEVVEDSRELEIAKSKTKSFVSLDDYIHQRSQKESAKKTKRVSNIKRRKSYV